MLTGERMRAEYIGCFKIRNVADLRQADPSHRWYDPHNLVFLGDDSRYAEGPFYALRGSIIRGILRSGLAPRLGGPEGVLSHLSKLMTGTFDVCHFWVLFISARHVLALESERISGEPNAVT